MNFSILEISIVTFLLAISGAISQFPVGKISDMYDRRKVIVFSTFGASLFAVLAILVSRQMYLPDGLATSKTWFYIFLILFSFAVYLCFHKFWLIQMIIFQKKICCSRSRPSICIWIRCDEWTFFMLYFYGYCWI